MIGTILLTKDNKYVKSDGSLPTRPSFDKDLLIAMCTGNTVSRQGFKLLPPSIQDVVAGQCIHYEVPITIKELANADLLIVVRSTELVNSDAKEFRLDKFKCVVKQRDIEIWSRK